MPNSKAMVKFQTWGTAHQVGSGIINALTALYRGENPGHASIEMQLPFNDANEALIETFCKKPPLIPYKTKKLTMEDGSIEEVYLIRFSFLGSQEKPFLLNTSYREDTQFERCGLHTTERDLLETLERTERRSKKRIIQIYPPASLTEKGRALDFSTPEGQYLLKLKEIAFQVDLLDTALIIRTKSKQLTEINLEDPKNKTILIAAQRLGIQLPKQGSISRDQLNLLLNPIQNSINKQIEQIQAELNALTEQISREEEKKQYKTKAKDLSKALEFLNNLKLNSDTEPESIQFDSLSSEELSEMRNKMEALFSTSTDHEFTQKSKDLQDELEALIKICNEKILNLNAEANLFFSNLDDYICYGRPADGEIHLPLGTEEQELNPLAMLEQMRQILDSGHAHNIRTHNCASTVLAIFNAGKKGKVSKVTPAALISLPTPQTIYNQALGFRNKICKISASVSFKNLDYFYAHLPSALKVQTRARQGVHLHEAILNFALNTSYPYEEDLEANRFYVFSDKDRKSLLKLESELIPTELLRDLWNIIPYRTLPLSQNAAHKVVIDKNMTFGQMIQGLTQLAQDKAENRLNLPHKSPEAQGLLQDPFEVLKTKIEAEIMRIAKRTDKKSIKKYEALVIAYLKTVHDLEAEPLEKSSREKSNILFAELTPLLKINTGFNLQETTSFRAIKKVAKELGIDLTTSQHNKYSLFQSKLPEDSLDTPAEFTPPQGGVES